MQKQEISIIDIKLCNEALEVIKKQLSVALEHNERNKFDDYEKIIDAYKTMKFVVEQLDRCQKILVDIDKANKEQQSNNNNDVN